MENEKELRLRTLARRLAEPTFTLKKYLFDKQLDFVTDKSPFKIAVCSRRSGKSVSCAADLIATAMKFPNTVSLYITLSRNNAKKIIWPVLQRICREYGLNAKEDATELSMRFENGSVIYLSGANDRSEIDKFRGLAIKICYIDECQSFKGYLEDLIDEVIAPALMDWAGTLCLIGTPGPVPSGYFHDCVHKKNKWGKHHWTFFDNPFIPQMAGCSHQELLDRELERKGVDINDPTIRREWFGEWVLDADSLILKYDASKNHFDELPPAKWDYLMGVDIGFVDADAIAVLAWSPQHEATYLVEELVLPKQDLTKLSQQIDAMIKKYDVAKIMFDEGGLGKKIAEEFRRRFHLPVQPADKARKMENMMLLNDAMRSGRFKAKSNSQFAQDTFKLEIDYDKTTPDKIKIKDTFHSDIIDAVLYGFKESPAFTYQAPKPKLPYGSKEWASEQVTEMEQRAIEHFEALDDPNRGFQDEWIW